MESLRLGESRGTGGEDSDKPPQRCGEVWRWGLSVLRRLCCSDNAPKQSRRTWVARRHKEHAGMMREDRGELRVASDEIPRRR